MKKIFELDYGANGLMSHFAGVAIFDCSKGNVLVVDKEYTLTKDEIKEIINMIDDSNLLNMNINYGDDNKLEVLANEKIKERTTHDIYLSNLKKNFSFKFYDAFIFNKYYSEVESFDTIYTLLIRILYYLKSKNIDVSYFIESFNKELK